MSGSKLDYEYRNGGRITENRVERAPDCVAEEERLRSDPHELARRLAQMGVTESGDEATDAEVSD